MSNSKSVGSLIRAARDHLKLTREQAAKQVGISPAYIGHLERDAAWVSEALIGKLAKGLKISATALTAAAPAVNAQKRKYLQKLAAAAEKKTPRKATKKAA